MISRMGGGGSNGETCVVIYDQLERGEHKHSRQGKRKYCQTEEYRYIKGGHEFWVRHTTGPVKLREPFPAETFFIYFFLTI